MNSVKFIHAADIHLGHVQYGLKERYKDFNRAFKWLLEETARQSVDFLLISGDFFNYSDVKPETMVIIHRYISEFKEKTKNKIPILVVEGNHDQKRYGTMRSWLNFLNEIGFINLLRPKFHDDSTLEFIEYDENKRIGGFFRLTDKNVNIYGVGWVGSVTQDLFPKISDAIHTDGFNILMMHFGMKGQISKNEGIEYDQHIEILKKKVDYLALGHFHKNYEIKDWIYNPGSLEINEFPESSYKRGIYIVEVTESETTDSKRKFEKKVNFIDDIPNRKFVFLPQKLDTFTDFSGAKSFIIKKLSSLLEPIKLEDVKNSNNVRVDLNIPIVVIHLSGTINYSRMEMDLESLKEEIKKKYSILDVRIQNNCESSVDGYYIEDEGKFDISETEKVIFNSFVSHDNLFNGVSEKVVDIMSTIKDITSIKNFSTNSVVKTIEDWWDQNKIQEKIDKIQEESKIQSDVKLKREIENKDKISVSKSKTKRKNKHVTLDSFKK